MARWVKALVPFGLMLAIASAACSSSSDTSKGGGGSDIASLVPADKEIGDWSSAKAPSVASSKQQAVDLIDGSAEPFFTSSYQAVAFAKQEYMNGQDVKLTFYLWQMNAAADCSSLYTDLLDNPLYDNTWTDVSVGDAGRVTENAGFFTLNARKGVYYIEVRLGAGGTQEMATAFAQAELATL